MMGGCVVEDPSSVEQRHHHPGLGGLKLLCMLKHYFRAPLVG